MASTAEPDMMDIDEPINEILMKFELQKKEIEKLKAELKKLEDDYMEVAIERDEALERLKLYEPTDG
jgi:peptidoglycan hydrolase CwlO-like protein